MPQFVYKAKVTGDQVLTGLIEAEDRRRAIRQLKAMGYFLLAIHERSVRTGWRDRLGGQAGGRVAAQDVAIATRQLASLMGAGLTLAKALHILARQCENPRLARVVASLASSVEGSKSLSEAMSKFPRVFNPQFTSIVRAGEEGGRLSETLAQLADYQEGRLKFREQLRNALVYPTFLCIFGIAVVVILLTFVIPQFVSLFSLLGQQLPLPTRALIGTASFLNTWWPVLAIGGIVLVLGFARTVQTRQGRMAWHRMKLELPILGRVFLKSQMAVFGETLSALLRSGVRIVQALDVAADTVSNVFIAARIRHTAEQVRDGSPLNEAMGKEPVFPVMLVGMTAVGEETGQLEDLLSRAAEILGHEAQRAIHALTTILEPALIVFLGGLVALIVAAILLPIFRSSALVQ